MNMEFMEFSAKTVNDAVTEACKHFTVPSDKLEYEVIEELLKKSYLLRIRLRNSFRMYSRL